MQNGDDDCKNYELSGTKLTELVELCKQVLDNRELANELLPIEDYSCLSNLRKQELPCSSFPKRFETAVINSNWACNEQAPYPGLRIFSNEKNYDEYYFEQLQDTIEQLSDIDEGEYYEYTSSW